jgi:hypothetical protein
MVSKRDALPRWHCTRGGIDLQIPSGNSSRGGSSTAGHWQPVEDQRLNNSSVKLPFPFDLIADKGVPWYLSVNVMAAKLLLHASKSYELLICCATAQSLTTCPLRRTP